MSRSGLKRAEHAKHLATVCKIHLSQAYKKLNAEVDFTLEQIRQVELHFGIQIIEATQKFDGDDEAEAEVEAIFLAGPLELPCYLEVGAICTDTASTHRYCAYIENSGWRVGLSSSCPASVPLYAVGRLCFDVGPGPLGQTKHIAILDDQQGLANNLRDYLVQAGFRATAFYDLPSFLSALLVTRFDGFFLDWLLDTHTSEPAMAQIRALQGDDAPIILITGGLGDGKADEKEVAGLIPKYKVSDIHMKPVRLQILAAILKKVLP